MEQFLRPSKIDPSMSVIPGVSHVRQSKMHRPIGDHCDVFAYFSSPNQRHRRPSNKYRDLRSGENILASSLHRHTRSLSLPYQCNRSNSIPRAIGPMVATCGETEAISELNSAKSLLSGVSAAETASRQIFAATTHSGLNGAVKTVQKHSFIHNTHFMTGFGADLAPLPLHKHV